MSRTAAAGWHEQSTGIGRAKRTIHRMVFPPFRGLDKVPRSAGGQSPQGWVGFVWEPAESLLVRPAAAVRDKKDSASLPVDPGHRERQIERLAPVQARVTGGLVAQCEVFRGDLMASADALGDVVAGEFDVDAALMSGGSASLIARAPMRVTSVSLPGSPSGLSLAISATRSSGVVRGPILTPIGLRMRLANSTCAPSIARVRSPIHKKCADTS